MNRNIFTTSQAQTDLTVLPVGEFVNPAKLWEGRNPSASMRKAPILLGHFDDARFDSRSSLPTHIGWGSLQLGPIAAITFYLQRGPNLLYWLANPADTEVWKTLEKWSKVGRMTLAIDFQGRRTELASTDFDLQPKHESLRVEVSARKQYTDAFLMATTDVVARGTISEMVSSDIPEFSTLNHIQICVVRPQNTGTVAMRNSAHAFQN